MIKGQRIVLQAGNEKATKIQNIKPNWKRACVEPS